MVVKVTVELIDQTFKRLISGELSREAASDFANSAIKEHDANSLEFIPNNKRWEIFEDILYLAAVDLKSSPEEYFHVVEDFVKYNHERSKRIEKK
jgi:hypothetical protein